MCFQGKNRMSLRYKNTPNVQVFFNYMFGL